MKKLISILFVITSTILCCMSICDISNLDCLKGNIPTQQMFVSETTNFDAIINRDAGSFQTFKILLFYVSILLLVLNSFIRFDKEFKIKGIINISIILVIATYILVLHNYVFYLMLINIYLLYDFITHHTKRDILCIMTSIMSACLCCVCIIMLYKYFRLPTSFDFPNIVQPMIQNSKHILTIFGLWIIPYAVMGIKALHKHFKQPIGEDTYERN